MEIVITALAIVIGGGLTLVLTSGPSPPSSAEAPSGSAEGAITIAEFAYDPPSLQAEAGTEIPIENLDGASHTVSADDGSFDSGSIDGGESGSVTIDEPGTYNYICEFHAYMKGTVEVK